MKIIIVGVFIIASILAFVVIRDNPQLKTVSENNKQKKYIFFDSDTLVSITDVKDYCHAKERFNLNKDCDVTLKSCGEVFIGKDNGNRDVFDMYFDINNEKKIQYNSNVNKFFFFSEKGGSSKEANSYFKVLSDTNYIIEIAIPWTELKTKPVTKKLLGFDFDFSDNDNGKNRETQIAWHADDTDIWLNPRLWGNIRLIDKESINVANPDSLLNSVYVLSSPKIDGVVEKSWNGSKTYEANNLLFGERNKERTDIKVEVKSMWDFSNLYFLVKITDDKIVRYSYTSTAFDYGWIENSEGVVIWNMAENKFKHSGGATKNVCADTVIHLDAGNYFICYKSDEGHSTEKWDNDPPKNSFYGISVQKR